MVKHYTRISKSFLLGLFILVAFNANALIQSKAVTGNWTAGGSWVGGVAPTSTDDVEIVSGANITINGATPVCNNVTVDAGGTLTGGGTLTVSASFTNNGTLSNAAGTITFASTTSNQSISGSGLSFFNLTINNTGTSPNNVVSLGNNITVGGSLTLTAGVLDVSASNYSVTITKNFTNNSGAAAFVPENGTVTVGGAAAAAINGSSAIPFYNLTIAGTVAVTCNTNSTTITNNMVVNSGSIATLTGAAITTTVDGTLSNSGSISVGAGTLTVLGTATNAGSGVLSFTTGTLNLGGNFSNSGIFTTGTGTVAFKGSANQSISGSSAETFYSLTIANTGAAGSNVVSPGATLTVNNTLTFTSGVLDVTASNYALNVGKNITNNASSAAFVPENGTVTIGGAAAGVINGSAASMSFYNLTFGGSTSTSAVTYPITVTNNMVVNSGVTATITGGFTETVATLNNSGTITANTSTLNVTGTATNNASGTINFTTGTLSVTGTTSNSGTIAFTTGIFTATGTLTNNGTISFTTGTFNIGSNFVNNLTFTQGTGTVDYDGTANQSISGSAGTTFYNLTINNTGVSGSNTVSLGAAITVSNVLTLTAGILDVSASNYGITANGTWTNNNSTTAFNGENGTVTIGAGAIINGTSGTTFYNLTLTGSATANTVTAPVTVSGTLTVGGGNTFTVATNTVNITGSLSNSGTITFTTGTFTISGSTSNAGTINFGTGNFNINAAFTNSGTIAMTTGTITATATITNNGTISFSTGTFNIGTNFVNNATFTGGTGTVDYDGTANQSISGSAGTTFYNLTINNTGASGSNTVSLGQAITVTNILKLVAGILDVSASNYGITANGTWTNNNTTLAFNGENGTVTLGPGAIINGTSGTTFYNLTLTGNANASTVTAPVTVTATLTVPATFTFTISTNSLTTALLANSGTIVFTTGTITLTSTTTNAGTITLAGGIFNANHNFLNSGTITVTTGTMNITGSATNSGSITFTTGTFNMNNGFNITNTGSVAYSAAGTLAETGSITINGTLSWAAAGTFTLTDSLIIGSTGTLTLSGAMGVALVGNFVDNGTFTPAGSTFTFNGSTTQTISGTATIAFNNLVQNQGAQTDTVKLKQPITINNNFTILQGVFNCGSNQITGNAGGNITMGGASTLILGSSTVATAVAFPTNYVAANIILATTSNVIFTANTNQTISGKPNYGNLEITGGSATTTNTLSSATTVNGNLLIQNGTGVVTFSLGSFALSVAGNYTDNGVFSGGTGTVTFNGSALQTLTYAAGGETFYGLTFNNTYGTSPGLTTSGNTNVTNVFTFTSGYLDLKGHNINITGGTTKYTDVLNGGAIITSVAGSNFTIADPDTNSTVHFYGTSIGNSTNGIGINVTAGDIAFKHFVEYGAASFTKAANVQTFMGNGNNVFHGPVTFTADSSTQVWKFGVSTVEPDTFYNATVYAYANVGTNDNFIFGANNTEQFYGTTTLVSTTPGGVFICRGNGTGNSVVTFHGPVVCTISSTGNVTFADASAGNINTAVFDSTITLNSTSTSTGFYYFGNSKYSTVLLNTGGQFLTGSISGKTNTYLEEVTQIGPKTQTINTSGSTGALYVGGTTAAGSSLPNTFNGPVNLIADTAGYIIDATFNGATNITINHANANGYLISDTCWSTLTATVGKLLFENNEFNGVTSLQHTSGNSSTVNGGNTFNAATTIINSGTASLYTGTSAGDNFNANVTFTESGTGAGNLIYVARTNTSNFAGNITVNGTNTNQVTFGSNAGNMNISGSGTQVFATSGSAVAPLIVNMTMNQTAAGTNIFEISNFSPSVSGTLTFNTGNTGLINLNNNTLTIGTSNAATGAISYPNPTTLAGWVYGGTLARWYPSATNIPLPTAASVSTIGFYPLGSAPAQNAFEPFWIATNGAGSTKVGNTISLSQGSTAAGNTVLASHYFDASWGINVYGISVANWKVNPTTLTINAGTTMQVMFGGNGFETFLTGDINASYATTTVGTYVIPSQFYGATDFEVERTGLTIGQATGVTWYVGTDNPGASPLPIQLTSFTAQCSNYYADLQWTTASESDNDFFTIEKTQDGVNYETVGTIKGAGTSSETHNYSMVDFTPLTGTSYYRLSQTDFDGITTIVQTDVYQPCEGDQLINAFTANGIINAQVESNTSGNYTFTLINSMGQTVLQTTKNVSQGLNIYKIPANYAPGVYILRITNGTIVYTNKLML